MSDASTTTADRSSATPDLAREHPGRGKIIEKAPETLIFKPAGTAYELHLAYDADEDLPLKKPLRGVVKVKARKVYSVPSGGNFVTPIMGEPRIVQGRVMAATRTQVLLHAGACVLVDLPKTPDAIDLNSGGIEVGKMLNVVVLPGATFQHVADA